MAAIRHRSGAVFTIVRQVMSGTHMVNVMGRGGAAVRVCWLGFICNAGTKYVPGSIAKMVAHEITDGDGLPATKWVRVPEGEYVLCWRVPYSTGGERSAVYAIVDDFGMPITTATEPFKDRPAKTDCAERYVKENEFMLRLSRKRGIDT